MTQRGLKGEQLREVSSPKLVYEFVKKMLSAALGGSDTVSEVLDAQLLMLYSDASTGGSAMETLAVTGLLATDTILAAHQMTAGASGTAMIEWSAQLDDSLDIAWTADPGAGAVIRLLVRRS